MDEYYLIYILIAAVGLLIFYLVIKAAVRDGMIEALSAWKEELSRKKCDLSDEEKQRIAEENRAMDEKEKRTNKMIAVVAVSIFAVLLIAGIVYEIASRTL